MTDAVTWFDDPYFDLADPGSLDGGTTNRGDLWHSVSPRWGHSMHTMCSYQGMFPAKLVHYFVQTYSRPGDLVLDPFSGRGTTVLQARVEGRRTIGNDLNPLGYVLTRAKAGPPAWTQVLDYVDRLERDYRATKNVNSDVPDDIRMLFHPHTLRQLCFVRDKLLRTTMKTWSSADFMVAGCIAGILHGATRRDGSSAYLSISMPNTFSMSPAYVKKYIREKSLVPPDQDVFARLREKLARQYLDSLDGVDGESHNQDAVKLLSSKRFRSKVDLLLTSPPYLRVVNYGTANWIRLWWLGLDEVSRQRGRGRRRLDAELDHGHGYEAYAGFMTRVFLGTSQALRPDGIAAFVIGDVTTPDGDSVALAQQLWHDVGPSTGLQLLDIVEDHLPLQNKVSRIWGDTRGRATERDCVLVMARNDGHPRDARKDVDWSEPYRDAGPDAAHAVLRRC